MSDLTISILSSLTEIKPYQYLLVFLFLQPFLGFTRNEELDLFKHLFYRIFSLSLLLYTLFFVSYQKGEIAFLNIGLEKYLLLYIAGVTIPTVIALPSGEVMIGRSITSLLTVPVLISLFYTVCYWFDAIEKIKNAIRFFLLSVVVVCIYGLVEFIVLASPGDVGNIRIRSVFIDPNIFARYILMGIFFIIPFLFFKNYTIFNKKTLTIFLALFVLSLLFSLSRSGYLTLIAGSIFFALFLESKKIKSFIIVGSIVAGLVIFTYLFTQRSFTGTAIIEQSNINRVQLILGGIDMIQSHWVTGIGYTNFANYFEKHYLENYLSISTESYKSAGFATEIHNWVIEVWAEQGIVGLIIFILLFYRIFSMLNTARKQEMDSFNKSMVIGFILVFFTFLFHGFFYHTFISQFFFWTIGGFGIALAKILLTKNGLNSV